MNTKRITAAKAMLLGASLAIITLTSSQLNADTGTCGGMTITLPFADVSSSNIFFCAIAEAYFSALTNGTSTTTYSPGDPVPREQMAAFVTRTLDQSRERGSRRAALDQFWTTQGASNLGLTSVGSFPVMLESDGTDVWVANDGGDTVSRVRVSDGKLLGTWTGATSAGGVLIAMGRVFITGFTYPSGGLYQIDPTQPPGAVTILSSSLPAFPNSIAFDGQRIWVAGGSLSIVSFNPVSVSTVTNGFANLEGILYDGANIWVTDGGDDTLKKLDANGNILQTVSVGSHPYLPTFDGANIWVPNTFSSTVSVVRASSGVVLATLSGNGMIGPNQAAFDGERILITSSNFNNNSASLWRASSFTPIGTFSTGANTNPQGACSDGVNFWMALAGTNQLARF